MDESNNVKSTVRTLRILELLESSKTSLSLTDVCKNLNLPKSSTFAIISTLVNEGYIEKTSPRKFSLSFALHHSKGWLGGFKSALRNVCSDELNRLLGLYGQSVVLGMPKSSLDIEIIDYRQSSQEMAFTVRYYQIVPGWCSSMGHCILANLPNDKVLKYLKKANLTQLTPKTTTSIEKIITNLTKWKTLGYALNIDERFDGASGVAVPILDSHGIPRAAINIVMLSPRFKEIKNSIIKELKISSIKIQRKLFFNE